ncbi:phenol degradation protein meta [Rhodoplanes roseus]|uniref:Phenol degradation protein meta n=2 Tax=Rhodoplanes roseus TaxID=29409 RepID=A0A327L568_9BRAD|nr:transporter [Rhodoplanes roseus]RAI44682.1 phenol degradation protein meta [Rhodoplanes roseus]
MSFWLPGIFGSLAAVPQQPGVSVTSIYYHTSVTADAAVARAKEIGAGLLPVSISASVQAGLGSTADLAIVVPTYTFASPVLGGQATIGLMTVAGRNSTSIDAFLNATALIGPFAVSGSRFFNVSETVTGVGDLYPQFFMRWNAGVNNYMAYVTGDIPVGAYDPTRIANIGIGHGAVDGGFGYTYFNPATGHEFSAVAGLTYNFKNPDTQYQNGVDFHLDWGASQFVTKQLQIGLVGYLYQQLSCDSGSGDRVGCFESRVMSVGAQVGYIVPMGEVQGYLNLKAYKEFESENRPEGWNVWLTLMLSPAAAPPPPSATAAKRMSYK